jgi:hypothetical protein
MIGGKVKENFLAPKSYDPGDLKPDIEIAAACRSFGSSSGSNEL